MEVKRNYIDGTWVLSETGNTRDVINPATGEVIAQTTDSNEADTERAIAAAKKSFYETRDWRDMDCQARADLMLKIANLMEENADMLARLDTIDNGKPLRESEGDVDMVTFTGSTKVGQEIMAAAVGNLKKVGLELGGKSPNIVFADADLDGAVEWAMIGTFFNQGEVCSACARIYVERSIQEAFVEKLVEKANAMTIGNGLENPDIGPLVTERDMRKVLGYIQKGIEEGAVLRCGGKRYTQNGCENGYFVEPTVFDNCTQKMTIVREEIFGPVCAIVPFDTEEEAIAMANDTQYGLAGTVCTRDGAKALRVMKEIRAGIIWINCNQPTFSEAPWGGYKMSGLGRELSVHGLEEYQEVKQVNIALETGPIGWYTNTVPRD